MCTSNTQGIAQSGVQGMVQSQITDNFQGTTQGLMGNAQAQPQIANVQGMTQGTMGNAQGIIQQNLGTGIFQQQEYNQGLGQSIANMTYVQANPQHAGAGVGMGDNQQLLNQMKQMSISNPPLLMALQELESRMNTNIPVTNMTGVSPGYNCQRLFQGAFQGNNQGVPNVGIFQGQNQGFPRYRTRAYKCNPREFHKYNPRVYSKCSPKVYKYSLSVYNKYQPWGCPKFNNWDNTILDK